MQQVVAHLSSHVLAATRRLGCADRACPTVAGRDRQLRTKVGWSTVSWPSLSGDGERLLERFLGQVEVAEVAALAATGDELGNPPATP